MNTGKEALTISNCELRIAESATSPRSFENSPAIHGWDPWFANFQSPARDERCLRTATIADGHQFLPSLTGLLYLMDAFPSHKWLGYCHHVAPRRQPPIAPIVHPKMDAARPRPALLPGNMATCPKIQFLDNNCPKWRQSPADWLNSAIFAGQSPSGKRFPVFGKPFPVSDQGFPALGKRFPPFGKPFPVLGKPFPISGKPLSALGKPFPVIGKPFPVLGKPFPVSNRGLPEAFLGRPKALCRRSRPVAVQSA